MIMVKNAINTGDKVFAVHGGVPDGTNEGWDMPAGYPVKDGIYCVSKVVIHKFNDGPHPRIIIVGLPAIFKANGVDYGWSPLYFRKIHSDVKANQLRRKKK